MKLLCKWIKRFFAFFLTVCLTFAMIYSIKSFAEIVYNIDNCKIKSNYANAKTNKAVVMGHKKSNFNITNSCFEKLCGCIKFSSEDFLGECCVMKSENRLLVASVSYSAPIFYSYSCEPKGKNHSREECIEKAKKTLTECMPHKSVCRGNPVFSESKENNLCEFVTFVFPDSPQCKITVGIRYDTLNPVYFDARQLYFSAEN